MRILSFSILFFWTLLGTAQTLNLEKVTKVPSNTDLIAVDQFGLFYSLQGSELQKLNQAGSFELSYSDPVMGKISQIDVLNPLGPLLYFQSANVLHVLDNRLNRSSSYNLSFEFQDPKSITAAGENSIWLYDQNGDRMLRYALDQKKILNQSPIISQITSSNNTIVLEFKSGFDQLLLYLKVEDKYWFLAFDAQGALEWKRELPFRAEAWDYHNQRIAVLYANSTMQFLRLDQEESPFLICPKSDVKQVFFFYPKVYMFSPNYINQYHLDGL